MLFELHLDGWFNLGRHWSLSFTTSVAPWPAFHDSPPTDE